MTKFLSCSRSQETEIKGYFRDITVKPGHVLYKRQRIYLSIHAQTGLETEANIWFYEIMKRKKHLYEDKDPAYQASTPRSPLRQGLDLQTEIWITRQFQDKLIGCITQTTRFETLDKLSSEIKRQFNQQNNANRDNDNAVKELKSHNIWLCAENNKLQTRVDGLKYQVQQKENEIAVLRATNKTQDDLKANCVILEQRLQRKEKEVVDLNKKIQQNIQDWQSSKQKLDELEIANPKIKRQRNSWKAKCKTLENQVAERDEHIENPEENYREAEYSEIARLQKENVILQRERDEAQRNISRESQERENKIIALRRDLKYVQDRATELNNKNGNLTRKIELLEKEIEHHESTGVLGINKLQNENARLRNERDEQRTLNRTSTTLLEEMKSEVAKCHEQITHLQADIDHYKNTEHSAISELQKENARQQSKREVQMNFNTEVAERDEKIANLQADIEHYKEAEHSEIAQLQKENARLNLERDDAQIDVNRKLQEKENNIITLRRDFKHVQERATELSNQNSSLTRKIEQLEGDVEHHKITGVSGTSNLQNENARLRKERNELRERHRNAACMLEDPKLEVTKHDTIVSNLEGEIASFRREIAALKNDLKIAEERATELSNQNSSLSRKIEQLEGDVEHHKITGVSGNNKLQTENARLRKERDELRELQRNAAGMLEDMELEVTKRDTKVSNLESEIESLRREIASKTENALSEMNMLRDEHARLLREKDEHLDKTNSLLRRKEKKINGLQSTEESLTNENDRLRTDINSWKDAHASLTNENDRLRTEINSWKDAHAREINANKIKAMQLNDTIRSLQQEKAALNNRLAAEMSARISANETTFENISIKSRPLNISQDYELLFSNSWLDAKMALDDHSALDSERQAEEWKVIMLLNMLQVSYTKARELYEDTKTQVLFVLDYPGTPMKGVHHGLSTSVLPQEILTFLSDHYRKHADTHNLDSLLENARSQLTNSGENALVSVCLEVDYVKEYLAQCTRISWKMVLQRPPMTLSTPGIGCPWNKNDGLQLVWGSNPDNTGAKIRYYKSPQLYHGDRLMTKGHVFVN